MHDPAHWRARIGTKTQSVLGGNGAPVRSATSRHVPWPHGATDLPSLGNGTADKRTPWITWSARHLEKLALNKEKGWGESGGDPCLWSPSRPTTLPRVPKSLWDPLPFSPPAPLLREV